MKDFEIILGVLNAVLALTIVLTIDYQVRDETFKESIPFIKAFKKAYDLDWFFQYGVLFVSTPSYVIGAAICLINLEPS